MLLSLYISLLTDCTLFMCVLFFYVCVFVFCFQKQTACGVGTFLPVNLDRAAELHQTAPHYWSCLEQHGEYTHTHRCRCRGRVGTWVDAGFQLKSCTPPSLLYPPHFNYV